MPLEPPSNGGYLVAAYIVTPIILLGYLIALWRRSRRALKRECSQPALPQR